MAQPDTIEVPWLVETVCGRPKLFTPNGTLEEVFCFLAGIYAGLRHPHATPAQRSHAQQAWYDFLEVRSSLHWPPCREWDHLYQSLRVAYPDDQTALAQLALSYRAYRYRQEGRPSATDG